MRGMMRLALLGVPGAQRGGGIRWSLKASFEGVDIAAGDMPASLGKPYVEVGGPVAIYPGDPPGAAEISVASGELVITKAANSSKGHAAGPAFARAPGLTMFVDARYIAGDRRARGGWGTLATALPASAAFYWTPGNTLGFYPNAVSVELPLGDGRYAVTLFETGAAFFAVRSGVWTLTWLDDTNTDATLYPAVGAHQGTDGGTYAWDNWFVRGLPAPFTDAALLTVVNEATPVSGQPYTATADAIHDLTVTAPNPLTGECALEYRVTDDDNKWRAYFNDSGAFRLDSVLAGTPTNRINVAGAIAAGETRTIRVWTYGSLHNCYTRAGITTDWTKRGSGINLSHQNTATTIKPVAGAGWVLGALRSYPTTSPAYAELDRT